jgi:hypothetical protein
MAAMKEKMPMKEETMAAEENLKNNFLLKG